MSKGGRCLPNLVWADIFKKSSLFYFYFSLERLLFSRASATSPLSLAPCFSIDQPAISSLLPPFGLSHPYASYYLQLLFFLYEKLNVHSSGPWVVFLFSPAPFIHPPVSKPTSRCLCLFVLVFNSFLAPSLFSYFFCQWTDFFLSRSGAD